MMPGMPGIVAMLAVVGLIASACSSSAPTPETTPTEPPAWAGSFEAHPVTGAQQRIYIAGTIGSRPGATLSGAETPYGRAELTATSGCIGGGPVPMSSWRIEPRGSISLVLGGGYLAVWNASGLPQEGSTMPVTLHFADAPDVTVLAEVQAVEPEPEPTADSVECSG
jgi:hypothetical protein